MTCMVAQELVRLYPTDAEGFQPQIPVGIGYGERVQALATLRAYYDRSSLSFGNPIASDSFRNLADLLFQMQPNSGVTETSLKSFYAGLPSQTDPNFQQKVRKIGWWLRRFASEMPTWDTCSYRPVWAVCDSHIQIEDRHYIIGAIGSSGGHEFFRLSTSQEKSLLGEALLEALVVRGFPLPAFAQQMLVTEIEATVEDLLKARHSTDPYAWSANCRDLSHLANQGADTLAAHHLVSLKPADQYHTCLMHKYNSQYASSWQAAGLPKPGDFGRLRCPSHCAESQAILRSQFAQLIPLLTGHAQAYVVVIGDSEIITKKETSPAIELIYLVPTYDARGFSVHRLTVDHRLGVWPFHPINPHPQVPYLYPWLSTKIGVKKYEFLSLGLDGDDLVVGGTRRLVTDGTYYEAAGDELARIKRSAVREVDIKLHSLDHVHTSAFTCIHCLNTMKRYGVNRLHIEKLDFRGLKGDDGLVLEDLMLQFNGAISVGQVVT